MFLGSVPYLLDCAQDFSCVLSSCSYRFCIVICNRRSIDNSGSVLDELLSLNREAVDIILNYPISNTKEKGAIWLGLALNAHVDTRE